MRLQNITNRSVIMLSESDYRILVSFENPHAVVSDNERTKRLLDEGYITQASYGAIEKTFDDTYVIPVKTYKLSSKGQDAKQMFEEMRDNQAKEHAAKKRERRKDQLTGVLFTVIAELIVYLILNWRTAFDFVYSLFQ